MKWKTVLSCFSMICLLGFSLFVPGVGAAEKTFTDYDKGDFGYDAVSTLIDEGVIQGYKDHSFKPNNVITRAETAIMFQRALHLNTPADVVSFKDVPASSAFANAAAAVKKAGIFKGNVDGTFGPTDQLTREQMASVLVRAFDLKPVSGVNVTINDLSKIASAHINDVKVLYQNGVTKGKAHGVYDPKGDVSRAEFSVFISRALVKQSGQIPNGDDNASNGKEEQSPSNGTSNPEENAQVELKVNSSDLTTTDGKVSGKVAMNKDVVHITYDLTNESSTGTIQAGTISVSTDSTLTLTDIPSPINLFVENGVKQELHQGENGLSFADKIGSTDADFGMIRSLIGNFEIGATLEDHDGNVINLSLDFIVK